eukprot:SAG31_NODE_312_length_17856_cov_14.557827_11_plen_203_part_00
MTFFLFQRHSSTITADRIFLLDLGIVRSCGEVRYQVVSPLLSLGSARPSHTAGWHTLTASTEQRCVAERPGKRRAVLGRSLALRSSWGREHGRIDSKACLAVLSRHAPRGIPIQSIYDAIVKVVAALDWGGAHHMVNGWSDPRLSDTVRALDIDCPSLWQRRQRARRAESGRHPLTARAAAATRGSRPRGRESGLGRRARAF